MPKKKSPAHFAKQAQDCYELSLAGFSQRQIAEKLGISQTLVVRRLKLYIEGRPHALADEWRNRQLDRAQIYIRSMWNRIVDGDEKAINAAIRTEERIARLLGLDSATAFKVEIEKTDDANEVQKQLDQFFSSTKAAAKTIPGEIVSSAGYSRQRRPLKKSEPVTYSATPVDEFRNDNTFQPHEVQPEAFDIEEPEPVPEPVPEPAPRPRRRKTIPNPADRFLVDGDD